MSLVKITIKNNIAYVALDRPDKLNALNMQMFNDINAAIKTLKKNKEIRAIILSGNGKDFCSGLDIKSVLKSPFNAVKLLFKWLPGQANLAQIVSVGWRKIPVPVIAVIHGRVWGGGLQIALGADFRIAAPDTQLSILEAKWGLIPDMGGTLALKELMQQDQAKLFAMTGRMFDAETALKHNLITTISPNGMGDAIALANELTQQSPDAVAAVKKLYNLAWWRSERFALAKESIYQIKVMLGKNQKIKTYNQTHDDDKARAFKNRANW